jgi:hypothetical protein
MVEVMGITLLHRGPLEWHHLPTKFDTNLLVGLKVNGVDSQRDGTTDTQTGW